VPHVRMSFVASLTLSRTATWTSSYKHVRHHYMVTRRPHPPPHPPTHTHPSEPCQELTQAEFEKIQWSQLEEIMGRDILAKRFIDKEETGKVTVTMRDVWRKLDINQESTITVH
jgi:hypothetical protein